MKHAVCLTLLMTLLLTVATIAETAKHEVLYFYSNYCEQCDPAGEFAEQFEQLTGLPADECDYTAYNTVRSDGQKALAEAQERYGLSELLMPTVIVDGIAYQGAAQMNTELATAALTWGDTLESTVVYLYVPACESCARAKAVLESLPESVELKRGSVTFTSPVTVTELDVSRSPATAQALFDAYGVPDDARVTPIVFFADRYLSGADAIEEKLSRMVSLGWAVGGVNIDTTNDGSTAKPFTAVSAIGAGLAAGLNTCALSMLLLFLSVLMESGRRAGRLACCFLLAKFLCYLLIGFLLLGLMQRFDPKWLKPLARWLLTVIGAVLIALNLWDCVQAHRGEYGKVRNQLPQGLRGGLRRVITRMTRSAVIYPAVILLGFIVAGGEFLCAGQLYLMQLLEQAQSGATAQQLSLFLYCAAFILPACVLSAVVVRGQKHARASMFLAEHMDLFKLITAVVMLGMIAAAWLL